MKKINYFAAVLILLLTILSAEVLVLVKLNIISPKLVKNISGQLPRVFIVESGSMEPKIKVGSLAFTVKPETYKQNDVITFTQSQGSKTLVTHRLVYKYGNVFFTKGDANKTLDPSHTNPDQVIGKVLFTIPYAGFIANFAKTPKGFILLVIIPATIVIYEEFRSLKQEFNKMLKKLKSKKKELSVNKPFPKASILIPLIACFFVFVSVSTAYFSDNEKSLSNILGAAVSYGEKTVNLYNSDPYNCTTGATDLNIPQAKAAVLKKTGGTINVSVQLIGATPNSSYDIWLNQDPGACPLALPTTTGAIITDGSGNGTGSASAAFVNGATNFWISAVGGGQVLRSTAVGL